MVSSLLMYRKTGAAILYISGDNAKWQGLSVYQHVITIGAYIMVLLLRDRASCKTINLHNGLRGTTSCYVLDNIDSIMPERRINTPE